MVEVYGLVPEYSGRGRPPKRKRPQPDWQYVQLVKQRVNGRLKGTRLNVIYGDETEVTALLGQSTAYEDWFAKRKRSGTNSFDHAPFQ